MKDSAATIHLASGMESCMGGEQAKQFIHIAGKAVVVHSYEALRKQMPNATIVIVAPVDAMAQVCDLLAHEPNSMIVLGVISRQASPLEGLNALVPFEPANVFIDNTTRPFVSGQIIQDVLRELEQHEAVDVDIPATDTIVVVRDAFIQSIPERKHILRRKTPQAFRYKTLLSCYKEVGKDNLSQYTDGCGIYLHRNPLGKVRIITGHDENIKITYPVDMILANEMLRLRKNAVNNEQFYVDVKDKRVLVFGSTSGTGKAIADIMREAGASVISRGHSYRCLSANI